MYWSTLGFFQPSRVLRCIDLPFSSTKKDQRTPTSGCQLFAPKRTISAPEPISEKMESFAALQGRILGILVAPCLNPAFTTQPTAPRRPANYRRLHSTTAVPACPCIKLLSVHDQRGETTNNSSCKVGARNQAVNSKERLPHVRTEATAASCVLAPQQTASCRTAC